MSEWFGDFVVEAEFKCTLRFYMNRENTSRLVSRVKISNWELKQIVLKLLPALDDDHSIINPNQIEVVCGDVNKSMIVLLSFFSEISFHEAIKHLDNKNINIHGTSYDLIVEPTYPMTFNEQECLQHFYKEEGKGFDNLPKGSRPDTLVVYGLPLKWFDISKSSLQSQSIFKVSDCLMDAFAIFGEISAIEASPSNSKKKSSSSLEMSIVLNFDVYVQYKRYEGFLCAMQRLSGGKALHKKSNLNLIVKLKVEFDRTEHMTDSAMRRRRFEREQKAIELDKKKEEFDALKKDYTHLEVSLKATKKKVKEELLKADPLVDEDLHKCSKLFDELKKQLKDQSYFLQVEKISSNIQLFKSVLSKVENRLVELSQKEKEKKLENWKKELNEFASDMEDVLKSLQKKFKKYEKNENSTHVAVFADFKSAVESIKRTSQTIKKKPFITDTSELRDVEVYMKQVEDDLDDTKYDIEAAIQRYDILTVILKTISKFNEQAFPDTNIAMWSAIIKMKESVKNDADYINELWSKSTEDIKAFELAFKKKLSALDEALDVFVSFFCPIKKTLEETLSDCFWENISKIKKVQSLLQEVEKTERQLEQMNSDTEIGVFKERVQHFEEAVHKITLIMNEEKNDARKREKREKAKQDQELQDRLSHEREIEANRISKETHDSIRESRKRLRQWQQKSAQSIGVKCPAYELEKLEKPVVDDHFQQATGYSMMSYMVPYELKLKSKVFIVGEDGSTTEVVKEITQQNEKEDELRSLALESKKRAEALASIRILKKRKSELVDQENLDEQELRQLALKSFTRK